MAACSSSLGLKKAPSVTSLSFRAQRLSRYLQGDVLGFTERSEESLGDFLARETSFYL